MTATGEDALLIERFLEMMAAEAGAAANTIAAYRTDLTLASQVLGGRLSGADAGALQSLGAGWDTLARATACARTIPVPRCRGPARRVRCPNRFR